METQRIMWMMDETIPDTHPSQWEEVTSRVKELVEMVGRPGFQHDIIDPRPCISEMVRQLDGEDFSCIFDLTGWLAPVFKKLYPTTPVISNFSLSRIRVVSSPNLETTGYSLKESLDMLETRKRGLDLNHPLILDDVSFTGWTSLKTMQLWGMEEANTTHAFLIANTGILDNKDMGAEAALESAGSKVVKGLELKSPVDDGWHVKDLSQSNDIERSLEVAESFWDILETSGLDSDSMRSFFQQSTVLSTLFPNNLTSQRIRELIGQNRFVLLNAACVESESVHSKNPFIWATPYFVNHIDTRQVRKNKRDVIETLKQIQVLTSHPGGRLASEIELARQVINVTGVPK